MSGSVRIWKVEKLSLVEVHTITPPVNLDEASGYIPGGAYTTFRTYQHDKTLPLSDHFARLERTATLAEKPLILDGLTIRKALRQVLAEYPLAENLRVRLTIDLEQRLGAAYICAQVIQPLPPSAYEYGVTTVTRRFERYRPEAKLTNNIAGAQSIRKQLGGDVNEALILDEAGHILEGLSSNFYAVRSETLWTAEARVLSGITRAIVLEQARQAGIPIQLIPVHISDLAELQEAFITSASRGVLPVCQVDDQPIGNGKPGPITRILAMRYQAHLEENLQPI